MDGRWTWRTRVLLILEADDFNDEIDVISVIPKNPPSTWSMDISDRFLYRITPSTKAVFLSRCYRLVFCLDLSPSIATVFYIPGSQLLFQPLLYVTVIAHMPFYTPDSQQVLVQGWHLTATNLERLLNLISQKLQVGTKIAEAMSLVNDQRERLRVQSEKLTGLLFDDVGDRSQCLNSQIALTTSDISTVNMLRYGILALQLLPENSSAGIIVLTDGMLTLPNSIMLESLLTQLRNNTIACSFIHLGSSYHPFCCFGFVPYSDLMRFIAAATLGAYLSYSPEVSTENQDMNIYHRAFLAWNFNGELLCLQTSISRLPLNCWNVQNAYFYSNHDQTIVRKKHSEGTITSCLSSILSCRLREGYTIKRVQLKDENQIEVTLTLPWKFHVAIEYTAKSFWPFESSSINQDYQTKVPSSKYEVSVEGTYDFLHDVTCSAKRPIKSPYRAAVVKQFWATLKTLRDTDQLLSHLQSFCHNPINYTIPDNIRNGVPLFYLHHTSNNPVLSSKNAAHTQFASFWRPICMMDINIWQKWMHTHRIGIILEHDMPLPKNVHLPNSSGRYNVIQCRQALASLDSLLREYSSFVLIENHSYIKFLSSEPDKQPDSFYIIRVSSKAPCMVIRLAFLGGTKGHLRNKIVNELREMILGLKFPRRGLSKELHVMQMNEKLEELEENFKTPLQRDWMEVNCCVLLKKPVEKILIKYDRIPQKFPNSMSAATGLYNDNMSINMLNTLSRYLYHQRWVWNVQHGPSAPLPLHSVAHVLTTLIKIRLQEGFHFSHSNSGIINMVLELNMQNLNGEETSECETTAQQVHPCVVQYIVFPPHATTTIRDSLSEEDDAEFEMAEADGELQLITECWIEPQYGSVVRGLPRCKYMQGLDYQQIAKAFYPVDQDCISSLITFYHLTLMCKNLKVGVSVAPATPPCTPVATSEQRPSRMSLARSTPDFVLSQNVLPSFPMNSDITFVSFPFDVMQLIPKCQQAELLFSTFIQELRAPLLLEGEESKGPNTLLFELLLDMVKDVHDREIPLSERDHHVFSSLVHERERDSKVYKVPFPAFNISSVLSPQYSFLSSDQKNNLMTTKSPSSDNLSSELPYLNILPKWRCFVKSVGSCMTVTLLPASYLDLQMLVFRQASVSKGYFNLENLPAKAVRIVSAHPDSTTSYKVAEDIHSLSFDGSKLKSESEQKSSSEETSEAEVLDSQHQAPIGTENLEKTCSHDQEKIILINGSITLPVYVYYCSQSSISAQLVYQKDGRRWKDIYHDLSFKMDEVNYVGDDTTTLKSDTVSSEGSKQQSPEPRSEESESGSDKMHLKNFCNLLETIFSRCFVHGIYRSLQQDHYINKHDIEAVLDGICREYVLEIDITHFLRFICGHVKDFSVQSDFEKKSKSKPEDGCAMNKDDIAIQKCNFPLNLLQRHHPCEHLQQRHADVKEKFAAVLKQFFKYIPARSDFYFFSPPATLPMNNMSEDEESSCHGPDDFETEGRTADTDLQMDAVEFSAEICGKLTQRELKSPFQESDKSSLPSLPSNLESNITLSSDLDDINSVIENESSLSPLFIHLICTLKYKNEVGNCSLNSLPTCLGDVISCLDVQASEIDLNSLEVTLDVLCLTLPPEIECPKLVEGSCRTTSFCSSSSPVPDLETFKMVPDCDDNISSLHSGINDCDELMNHLKNLPRSQYDVIISCVDKVKWMLQDEITTAALDAFPVTSDILKMVADHVINSVNTSCCMTEEVPLQFVFGTNASLDKFLKEFQRMTIPGYHLGREGDYYYMRLDAEAAKIFQQCCSSLVPPLGITRECVVIPYNAHADDCTELQKLVTELDNIMGQPNSENGYEVEIPNLSSLRNVTNDETETDDREEQKREKFRPNKRTSRERLSREAHSSSVPLSFVESNLRDDVIVISPRDTRSAPAEFPVFLRNVGSLVDSEEIVTEEAEEALTASMMENQDTAFVSAKKIGKNENLALSEKMYKEDKDSSCDRTHFLFTSDLSRRDSIGRELRGNRKDISARAQVKERASSSPPIPTMSIVPLDRDRANSLELPLYNERRARLLCRLYSQCESDASTPLISSEADKISFVGSGHVSTNEDGYDGDSSNTDSEFDLFALDSKRPILPRFWLIMIVQKDRVSVYFHLRHQTEEDEALKRNKQIFRQTIRTIKNMCKLVNQTLLLQDLHDSHMCNQLLVPETSEDIWKSEDALHKNAVSLKFQTMNSPDGNSEFDGGYLEAAMKFQPGTFACGVVWQTHFPLHPRLSSGPTRVGMSRGGIHALKGTLNSFCVSNRKNMFVYKEHSGSVFYLRLYETSCQGHHGNSQTRAEDSPLADSRSSSYLSLHQKKTAVEGEEDFSVGEFRPRLNSQHSDKDQSQDSISITSRVSTTKKISHCIQLHVHGIAEVGSEMKDQLVKLMQNRLDESLLDIITAMLARNPMCKLTSEDAQFIQKPGKEPTAVLHFTVHIRALPFLHAVMFYLHQNLLNFLHNPKYTDAKPENHFHPYPEDVSWSSRLSDDDVFLYFRHQASGTSGNKGIACIILSTVDGKEHPVQCNACPMPNPMAYKDGLLSFEYEELTSTSLYDFNNETKLPGPLALIRFQIWCVGKVDLNQLTDKLKAAIRHSLWDVVMEYRLLTAPYAECPEDETLFSMSEPTTPVNAARRTGRTIIEQAKDQTFPLLFLNSRAKEYSSSVPELMGKEKTPVSSPTESVSFFKFSGAGPQDTPTSLGSASVKSIVTSTPQVSAESLNRNPMYDSGDKGTLVEVFHTTLRPFLEFGELIGVPTIQKYQCTLANSYEIPTILQQFQAYMDGLSPDACTKIFKKSTDSVPGKTVYISHNSQTKTSVCNSERLSEQDQTFIAIGRNIIHWRAFMGCSELSTYVESFFSKKQKSYQKFQPYVFGAEKLQESVFNSGLTSPIPAPVLQGNSPSFDSFQPEQMQISFIPRQRLILLFMEKKDLFLYLYNWTTDTSSSIRNLLCNLIRWNNARSVLLDSILAQKLGLFHNQPLSRVTRDGSTEKKQVEPSTPSYVPYSQAHVEQLLNNVAPPKAEFHSVTQRSTAPSSGTLASWYDKLRDAKPPKPLCKASYRNIDDPVARHNCQLKDIRHSERRSLEDLHRIWQSRGPNLNIQFMDRQLQTIKQAARLSHFCLTPILFSPTWRWKVAPIRDHTLEPVTIHSSPPEKYAQEHSISTRSRHGSGASLKLPVDVTAVSASGSSQVSKMRRPSGPATSSIVINPPSPKPRRSQLDDAWHIAICANYIQEYVQYLQTLGFVAIQTKPQSVRTEMKMEGDSKAKVQVLLSAKNSSKTLPTYYLIKCLLGGLLVFQIGFRDPYAYGYLYSLESKRLKTSFSQMPSSQFTTAFLDELDKIKVVMHLHSFTYDYHLRTIHSYISGRQLLFRQGYHLTIFLDDFIKYYQKSPNYARNLIHAGQVVIPNTSMPGQQLYDYIISHNQLYGMTVLRMVPVFQSSDMDTEFSLVELSTYKVSYKDVNEVYQSDNFDVGLLITHDTTSHQSLAPNEKHVLALNYYILLTSQRDLYPQLNFGPTLGSFQPVRLALSQPSSRTESRKSSNISAPPLETFRVLSQDPFLGSLPVVAEQRRSSCIGPTMCDEEVTYLGYFSRHETLMLKILQEKADLVHTHLKAIVGRAGVHCCRDFLWNCIFQKGRAEDAKDGQSAMTFSDFTELLNLVTSLPLNVVDPELTPFMNMHISWYQSLARILTTKYTNGCQYFTSPDNSLFHVAITNPRCLDSFMRLSINQTSNRAELCLVFREPLLDQEHSPEKPNFRVLQLQALVEDFVNACCFHLWSGMPC